MPNRLARVVNTASPMVASISRTILARPGTEHVFTRFNEVMRMLKGSHSKIADMLEDAGAPTASALSRARRSEFSLFRPLSAAGENGRRAPSP